MLTAHGHILHPEYLQPLASAPVSIELDAKKSPLALLAQTCSQIGKPDPPPSSKLASLSSNGLSDKDSSTRSSGSSVKSGDQHHDDKSSFKPYSKAGGGSGECRKDGLLNGGVSDKAGFRVPGGSSGGTVTCPSFPPHATSPRTSSPPQHTPPQAHHRQQSQSSPTIATGLTLSQKSSHAQSQYTDSSKAADPSSGDSGREGSNNSSGGGGVVKKEPEHQQQQHSKADRDRLDHAQIANSSHARASANSSNASSAASPQPDSKAQDAQLTPQSGLPGAGHVAPVSPFKPGHSVFPLPPSSMGYHGSIVGAYAGYPSQFGSMAGLPGKHPSSSPLTGASPPSFMQGLCRDPYCLTYPNAPHLGGSNCNTCVHDPSSTLKSAGYPLMYPSHHLHSLHPGALASATAASTHSLSHPLYTYGFMLPSNEPQPHACNWVSVGGPCDKRFASSEELLAHLRTHTALHGGVDGSKLLSAAAAAASAYPSSVSSATSCHLHLPPTSPGGALPASYSLRGSPGLSLARYHPYAGKAHLPGAPSLPPMHSLQGSPYYSPYSLYSQRLASASALGYQ